MKRIAAVALSLACAAAPAQEVHDALDAGDLLCEIRQGYRLDVLAALEPLPPRAGLMLVYESVRGPQPRVVSSQRPGRHAIEVRVTPKAVHFVEPVGPSVRQTTLTECLETKWKGDLEYCVRFAARHAWHFDTRAYSDPDAALEHLTNSVSHGVCEPWTVD